MKITFKGYEAIVELDEEAKVFSGEVINTRDVITFEGKSVEERDAKNPRSLFLERLRSG